MKAKWSKFEIAWLIIITLTITLTIIIKSNGIISNIASVCGVVSTFLFAKQNKCAYIFSTVNALLYGLVVLKGGMYGSAFYNLLYNFPMQIYGAIYWTKSESKRDLGIRTLNAKIKLISSVIIILIITLAAYILNRLNGSMVVYDSIIMILSYIAVFLMTNKYMEQWIVWIITNFTGTVMWLILTLENPSNLGLLIMWVIFLMNSLYGFVNWQKIKNSVK